MACVCDNYNVICFGGTPEKLGQTNHSWNEPTNVASKISPATARLWRTVMICGVGASSDQTSKFSDAIFTTDTNQHCAMPGYLEISCMNERILPSSKLLDAKLRPDGGVSLEQLRHFVVIPARKVECE